MDSKIAELLHPFEEIAGYKDLSRLDCLYKKLKFNPANGITVSNTKAVDIPLLDSSENEKIKYDKKGFVLDLEKYGMIHSVRFSQDRQKISFIFNQHFQGAYMSSETVDDKKYRCHQKNMCIKRSHARKVTFVMLKPK